MDRAAENLTDTGEFRALSGRHFLGLGAFAASELEFLLSLANEVKREPERYRERLLGKTLVMLFEKPSLRTRATFEIGMLQLGGFALYFGPSEVRLGKREAVKDVSRNVSRWADVVMARVFGHQTLVEFAEYATIPVINGLSDLEHPCQAMGDLLTLKEHKGRLQGLVVAWVGDGNNVAHSLLLGACRLGVGVRMATPAGYEPDPTVVASVLREGGDLVLTNDPAEAVYEADAVYTDVWTSMGQESELEVRAKVFRPFQVHAGLMRKAGRDALFMHCLPAHRGQEVTDDVMESARSVVFDQAENRLHIQKAILLALCS